MTNEHHTTMKAGKTYVKYGVVAAVILLLGAFLLPQVQRMRQHSVRINAVAKQSRYFRYSVSFQQGT